MTLITMHCLVKNITLLHRAHNIHTKYIMTKVSAVEIFFLNVKHKNIIWESGHWHGITQKQQKGREGSLSSHHGL